MDSVSPNAQRNISVHPIAAFSDNYIWSVEWPDGSCVLVDPGEAEPVRAYLSQHERRPQAILVTHHHRDHMGGVASLSNQTPVPVYGPADIACVTHPVTDGETIRILGLEFQVLAVPGHTLDHLAYLTEADHPWLFCGDTLFAAGCGRLFEGTAPMMYASLSRFAQLPDDTRIFCAHEYTLSNLRFAASIEPDNVRIQQRLRDCEELRRHGLPTLPSILALEKETNPFLRCEQPDVIARARQQDPAAATPEEVFAIVRGLKDRF